MADDKKSLERLRVCAQYIWIISLSHNQRAKHLKKLKEEHIYNYEAHLTNYHRLKDYYDLYEWPKALERLQAMKAKRATQIALNDLNRPMRL